ncbi:MAG: serine protease, partial [Pseudomonadota bacterium]
MRFSLINRPVTNRPVTNRPLALIFALAMALVIQAPPALTPMAEARGAPDSFADLAERLLPSVVNISTTQNVGGGGGGPAMPDLPNFPPGTPFEEFFRDFFERQQGERGGRGDRNRQATSFGSGFVIDARNGYIVTNNH